MHYTFIDTETTDATTERGVVEVGIVVTDENFNVLREAESLIDPQRLISPSASGVHGLTNDDVKDSPTLEEYFSDSGPECYGGLIQGPAALIGHRVSFDTHTLGRFVDGGFTELCTLRWVRRLYPEADDHKLSTLIFALDLPRSAGAHRALADVYSAMYLAQHICERTGLTLHQLVEASKPPMEVLLMPFGKHKGTPIAEMPKHYIEWALREMKDLDRDLVHTLNLALEKKRSQR